MIDLLHTHTQPKMTQKTATLIGATGLIGAQILQQLLEDPYFSSINVLVRRPIDLAHPKVKVILLDFANEASYQAAIAGSDVVFCSVGTTLKQVNGDMVAYRKIDYDIPVNAAGFALLGLVQNSCWFPPLVLIATAAIFT